MAEYDVIIAGAGLAGSEAAYQLASHGYKVKLIEMRPDKTTPAHESDKFGELVCSNSLKSIDGTTSSGLLKKELSLYGSFLIDTAYKCSVPAGNALAVDRISFSNIITDTLKNHKNIDVECSELKEMPLDTDTPFLIATGPLTSDDLASDIKEKLGGALYFADAISPIIDAESIDMDKGYFLGRYNKGGDDYFNIPLTEEEYNTFYDDIMNAPKTAFHDFEDIAYFEGCMPIEIMAERGRNTLAFGPMKPVGLIDPKTNKTPYAVIQLRKENKDATAFNIVGFQTKMTISAQKEVFRKIPALRTAEFLRFGSVHRNTYIISPKHLTRYFNFKSNKNLFIAGQITGLEGYVESIAGGLIAALQISRLIENKPFYELPKNTALGCLSDYISGISEFSNGKKYSPSNFHLGMLAPLEKKIKDKKLKKQMQVDIAYNMAKDFYEGHVWK